ncbi:MAG: CAP domain-containing protein [Tabrizicola sp.]
MAGALLAFAGEMALACDKPPKARAIEVGIADWINSERAKKGLRQLSASSALGKAASAHACDMAKRGFFGHAGPGGPSFKGRLQKAGFRLSAAVENIARSTKPSAETAARLWRDSLGHWANVLNPAIDKIGVAVATDGSEVYYVFVGGAD